MLRCIGKHENITTTIENTQQNGHKTYANKNIERKATSEIIMKQIRANRQLTTLLEGLPLSPVGLRKKTRAEEIGTPFPHFFSFSAFVSFIKSPEQAFAYTDLDPETKVIVQVILSMRKQKKAADRAKYK